MKKEFKFNFNGIEYKAQEGTKTVNFNNEVFTVNKNITSYQELRNEVIEFNAIENINYLLPQLLEQEGFDDRVKPNLYGFIDNLEMQDLGFRELSILANLNKVFLYGENYLKLSSKAEWSIIVDLKGNVKSLS